MDHVDEQRLLAYVSAVDEALMALEEYDRVGAHEALVGLLDAMCDDLGEAPPPPNETLDRCTECGTPIPKGSGQCIYC